jgi:hypothetical protein
VSERTDYLAAASSFAELVGRVPTDAYDGPGLGDWDLRALVGHTSRALVTVLTYLDQPGDPDEVEVDSPVAYFSTLATTRSDPQAVLERGRAAGAALGADPAERVARTVSEVRATLEGFDDDYVLTTIAGPMRLADYLPTRTFELVVHGLDIGAAAHVEHAFDEPQVASAAVLAARVAVRLGRGEDLLLAMTGRRSLPDGFSVV